MKIETPQILWHNGSEGNGKPAPLYSVSLLPSSSKAASSVTSTSSATSLNQTKGSGYDILATAGNTNEVHIWKITFPKVNPLPNTETPSSCGGDSPSNNIIHNNNKGFNKRQKIFTPAQQPSSSSITLSTSITRHQRSVNIVSFSPRGSHLASAGDGGSFMIHSIPTPYRQSVNTTELFWKEKVSSEGDLNLKVLNTYSEDVMDLSWSRDEKRVVLGSLDHSVFVFEESFSAANTVSSSLPTSSSAAASTTGSSMNATANATNPTMMSFEIGSSPSITETTINGIDLTSSFTCKRESAWTCVWKNAKEHTHYVQGVAFDPLGVYLASQGSDRTVRVWQRKRGGGGTNGKNSKNDAKKKVLAVMDGNANESGEMASTNAATATVAVGNSGGDGPRNNSHLNTQILSGKFEVGKAKTIKYRNVNSNNSNNSTNGNNGNNNAPNSIGNDENNNNTPATKKRYLFADESSVESFFRRLSWTKDGAFLITPASLWHSTTKPNHLDTSSSSSTNHSDEQHAALGVPTFATYLFARHQYDRPYKVLSGLDKPSVVIRPNPILFQLPKDVELDLKENMKQSTAAAVSTTTNTTSSSNRSETENIPYRSIFAVLTIDAILIYDTYHTRPLSIARGLHYAGLTDCSWTSDGRNLIVCSTDGYVSILSFAEGELGQAYSGPINVTNTSTTLLTTTAAISMPSNNSNNRQSSPSPSQQPLPSTSSLPPCEPGQSASIAEPPSKKVRVDKKEKKRIAPTLLSTTAAMAPTTAPTTTTAEASSSSQVDSNMKDSENAEMKGDGTSNNNTNDNDNNSTMEKEVVGAVTNLSIDNDIQGKMNQIPSTC